MTWSVSYEVFYHYYQYNSGAADNGNKSARVEFGNEEDAHDLVRKIEAAVAGDLDDEEASNLRADYIPWDGYFHSARAYRIDRTPIVTPTAVPSGRP